MSPRASRFVLALALAAGSLPAAHAGAPAGSGREFVVGWRRPVDRALANRVLLHAGAIPIAGIAQIAVDVVRAPAGASAEAVMRRLRSDPAVEFAYGPEPMRLLWEPNDYYFQDQYALHETRAPKAWDIYPGRTPTKPGPTIAVIDTGVNDRHTDMTGRVLRGYHFYGTGCPATAWLTRLASDPKAFVDYIALCSDGSYRDTGGHGTPVASVAAAKTNNSIGIASIAYGARILPIRCELNELFVSPVACAAGIVKATDAGARVVNLSWGGPLPDPVVLRAVLYAEVKGVVVVASRGNEGDTAKLYPACFPTVIGVSATMPGKRYARWSSYGGGTDCTWVSAPGHAVWAATKSGWYQPVFGTSFSSPEVAAVAALLLGRRPFLAPASVRDAFRRCSQDLGSRGHDDRYGYGLIDAYKLLTCA